LESISAILIQILETVAVWASDFFRYFATSLKMQAALLTQRWVSKSVTHDNPSVVATLLRSS
jgi:hypothetical protein